MDDHAAAGEAPPRVDDHARHHDAALESQAPPSHTHPPLSPPPPQEKLAYMISDLLAKFMLLFVYAAAIK